MQVIDEPLPGVLHVQPTYRADDRGWFSETYNRRSLEAIGIDAEFVQDNQSLSRTTGTVRGLHLQLGTSAQAKLVQVLSGAVLDVAVDLRPGSTTFGRHAAVRLDAERGDLLWIPVGFAHGFCTLAPDTRLLYKVTTHHDPAAERSLRWDDPTLGIAWPVSAADAVLSDKDRTAPRLAELAGELTASGPAGGLAGRR